MYIHVNTARVVIDVTSDYKLVGKNEKTGKKIIVTKKKDALGVIGSDGNVKQLSATAITEDEEDLEELELMKAGQSWTVEKGGVREGRFCITGRV